MVNHQVPDGLSKPKISNNYGQVEGDFEKFTYRTCVHRIHNKTFVYFATTLP